MHDAKLALAKMAGVLLAYPGLKLEVDGYTDSTGHDEFNQTLSDKRAEAVRTFLVQQGVSPDSMVAKGFGPANPIASNDTAQGRKLNRRVDMIVSGSVIGTRVEGSRSQSASNTPYSRLIRLRRAFVAAAADRRSPLPAASQAFSLRASASRQSARRHRISRRCLAAASRSPSRPKPSPSVGSLCENP